MRVPILIILSTLNIYLNAQNNTSYSIEGRINAKFEAHRAYLSYNFIDSNALYLDSCDIKNGKFSFSDTLSYTIPATLSFVTSQKNAQPIDGINFHLDPRHITVDYKNSSDDILISGSPTTDLFSEYLSLQSSLQEEGHKLQQIYQNATPKRKGDKQFKDSLDRWYKDIQHRYDEMSLNFISQHPQSMLSIYMLLSAMKTRPSDPNIESIFDQLSDSIKNSIPGKVLLSIINHNRTLPIGIQAPDFTCSNQHGETFRLSDIRNKYILLTFWSPDCSHCLNEMQNLKRLYEIYGAKQFEIVNVAIEYKDRMDEWLKIIKCEDLEWINVSDLDGWLSQVVKLYKVNFIPYNYLIDTNGKIIAKDIHNGELFNALEFVFE